MLASTAGKTDVMELLIKRGADVDARNEVKLCALNYVSLCVFILYSILHISNISGWEDRTNVD